MRSHSTSKLMAETVTSRVVLGCAVNQTADKPYYLFDGYAHLAAGLACGLAGLAAGMAIGIVGDAGVRYVPKAMPLLHSLHSANFFPLAFERSRGNGLLVVSGHFWDNTYMAEGALQPLYLQAGGALQGQRAAAQALCRHDSHPHFRGGAGAVRPDWCAAAL